MRRPAFRVALTCCMACSPQASLGDGTIIVQVGSLDIVDGYAPASPAPDVASLYFTIVNNGEADSLLGVSTSAGGQAMLHRTTTTSGSSRMEPVEAALIPPNGALRLAPGGYHVMITALPAPLVVGDTLSVTLRFSRTPSTTFPVPVLTYTDVVTRLERRTN